MIPEDTPAPNPVDEPVPSLVAGPAVEATPVPDPVAAEPRPLISPLEVIGIFTIVVVDQITKFVVKQTIPLY